jgi:fatty-acyl-CoA synthase
MDLLETVAAKTFLVRTLVETGVARPSRPDRILGVIGALHRWGPTPAGGYAASAARFPTALALVDELGPLTFAQLDERTSRLANAWMDAGVKQGDGVAILCRNHRGFIEATVAASKIGADALYLNTMFAGPQIADVCRRENPAAIVHDAEFTAMCDGAAEGRLRFVGWTDPGEEVPHPTLEELIAAGDARAPEPPSEKGRVLILTSGTTGTPKSASRKQPDTLDPAAALLAKIPLRSREATVIAAPMFHSWGFAHFTLSLALSSTLILRRRFDPVDTLEAVAAHRATALVVVPVMLSRILELGSPTLAEHPTPTLRIIASSGSALPGELAVRTMDRFGDVLYNLYGSTEVAWATIATPEDLRAAPGTAGRPPFGTTVKLLDESGHEVPAGETGRIFVGNGMVFEGYTGGGGKEVIDGLMSTGDVGHFDEGGRLFVDGRDDEMIVSGGENVFPREVEDLLADHPDVEEAAVVGVPDEEFGQRLAAYVVLREGGTLDDPGLRAHVKANLAGFKVPRDVFFLDELPRNATGKVVKRELDTKS